MSDEIDTEETPSGEPAAEGDLVQAAVTGLRERGLRLTPQRLMILELLGQTTGHVAPEDIYQQVHQRFPMINRSTVYRTLDVLEELGLVRHGHVSDGAARYHLAQESHHLHLICHRCGHTIDVTDLDLAQPFARELQERFGFQADLTHFPVSGVCKACVEDEGC